MPIAFEMQQSLFCVFTNSQLYMEIFTFTLSTILWFIQLCTVLCTVNQAVKASVYFSKIAWSKLFLCNTYINPISNIMFWQLIQTNFHGFLYRILNIKLNNKVHTICFLAKIPRKIMKINMEFFAISLHKVMLEKGYQKCG